MSELDVNLCSGQPDRLLKEASVAEGLASERGQPHRLLKDGSIDAFFLGNIDSRIGC